jgi:hypothetical protein
MVNMNNITFNTEKEAYEVLNNLKLIIERGGVAYKSDLYNLCGINVEYKDICWGWFDLTDARVEAIGSVWKIHFPIIQELVTDPIPEKHTQFTIHGHPNFPDGKTVDTYQEVLDLVPEARAYGHVCQVYVIKSEVLYAWRR